MTNFQSVSAGISRQGARTDFPQDINQNSPIVLSREAYMAHKLQPDVFSAYVFINMDNRSSLSIGSNDSNVVSVHSHAQRLYAEKRRNQKSRELDSSVSPSTKAIASSNWRLANDNESSSPSPTLSDGTCNSSDKSLFYPTPDIGQVLDPFDCTAMSVDPNPAGFIQFYLDWTSPLVYGSNRHLSRSPTKTTAPMPQIILGLALHSKLHMLSLLTYIATMMEYLRVGNLDSKNTTRMTQKAIAALQRSVQLDSIDKIDLLYDISFLCLAAENRDEEFAASAHLRVLRQVVDRAGGIKAVPRHLAEIVLGTGLSLACSRVRRPTIPLILRSNLKAPARYTANSKLSKLAEAVIRPRNAAGLREMVDDTIECAQWAAFIHTCPGSPDDMSRMARKSRSVTHRILSTFNKEHTADRLAAACETSRVALLLWNAIIFAIALGPTTKIRRYLRTFKCAVLSMYRIQALDRLQEALSTWNLLLMNAVDSEAEKYGQQNRLIAQLVQVVIELERAGDVQMGVFMEQILIIIGSH